MGNVVPGQAVVWAIQSGPGIIASSQDITDENGQANATITSTEAGITKLRCTADLVYGEATKTWKAGVPASLTLEPASAENVVGINHTVIATVKDANGNVVSDAPISWSLSGVGSFVGTPSPQTDQNGQATAIITSIKSGQSTVTASMTGTTLTASAVKTWLPLSIVIDIKPGSLPNSINVKSNGVIPVAILSTSTFDATTVNPLSVRFGPGGAKEVHKRGHLEDVNHDGLLDMVLHFSTKSSGIKAGDTSAILVGETKGGMSIMGSDSVRTVPPKPPKSPKK